MPKSEIFSHVIEWQKKDGYIQYEIAIGGLRNRTNCGLGIALDSVRKAGDDRYVCCMDIPIDQAKELIRSLCTAIGSDNLPEEALEFIEI